MKFLEKAKSTMEKKAKKEGKKREWRKKRKKGGAVQEEIVVEEDDVVELEGDVEGIEVVELGDDEGAIELIADEIEIEVEETAVGTEGAEEEVKPSGLTPVGVSSETLRIVHPESEKAVKSLNLAPSETPGTVHPKDTKKTEPSEDDTIVKTQGLMLPGTAASETSETVKETSEEKKAGEEVLQKVVEKQKEEEKKTPQDAPTEGAEKSSVPEDVMVKIETHKEQGGEKKEKTVSAKEVPSEGALETKTSRDVVVDVEPKKEEPGESEDASEIEELEKKIQELQMKKVEKEKKEAERRERERLEREKEARKKKILTLLSTKDDADSLQKILGDDDYRVDYAGKEEEALEKIQEKEYSALALDITIQGMDGRNFIKKLKEQGEDLAIIVVTDQSGIEESVELIEEGAFDYVTKPITGRAVGVRFKNAIKMKEDEFPLIFPKIMEEAKPEVVAEGEAEEEEEKKEDEPEVSELERQKGYLEWYENDEDYAEYAEELKKKITAMEAYAEEEKGGFPLTSSMATKKETLLGLQKKKKSKKKKLTKKDKQDLKTLAKEVKEFEELIGQTIEELQAELEELKAEEEAARKAEEEEAAAAAEEEAAAGEDGIEGEGAEFEVGEIEVAGVEIEAGEIEMDGVEIEAAEIEMDGVEIEAGEIEMDGVEIEAGIVEAEDLEIEAGEIEVESAEEEIEEEEEEDEAEPKKKKGAKEPGAEPKKINCPRCNAVINVATSKRPYSFHCPKCDAKITLVDEKVPEKPKKKPEAKEEAKPKPARVQCPRCLVAINVATSKRPYRFKCPDCQMRLTIDKDNLVHRTKRAPPRAPRAMGPSPAAPGRFPTGRPVMVRCMSCQTPINVATPVRPYTFNCPRCRVKMTIERNNMVRTAAAAPFQQGAQPTMVRCPHCQLPANVATRVRPYTFNCPSCGLPVTLNR